MNGVVFRCGGLIVMLVLALASCKGSEESTEGETIENPTIPEPAAIPVDSSGTSQTSPELAIDLDPTSYTDYLAQEDDRPEPVMKEFKELTVKYDNGNIKRLCNQQIFENGEVQYHGKFKEWWDNGQVWKEGQYKDGRQTGEWKFFARDKGQLTKQGRFVDGRPDGEWTYFRQNGTRQRIESYAAGKRNGVWVEFDSTGKIGMQQFNFQDGKRHGKSTKWFLPKKVDETRRKFREIEYNDGLQHGKASEWYDTGQLKTEIHFKGGKRHGRATQWDPSGKTINEMQFKDGELVKKPRQESSPQEPEENPADN